MSISFDVPGKTSYQIDNIVFDLNGTLTVDGQMRSSTRELLQLLSEKVTIYILTADTQNSASLIQDIFDKTILTIFSGDNTTAAKQNFVKDKGGKYTAAVGNGANDAGMLYESILGIAVLEEEGCSAAIIYKADVVVRDIDEALKLFLNPKRLIATLRS